MRGIVIIGLDFGMALTKCAVAIQPPNQSNFERFVIGFDDDAGGDRFHLPSGVWLDQSGISIREADLAEDGIFHSGLKRRLIEAWTNADSEVVPGVYVTECVFFALASILARVRRSVSKHLDTTGYSGVTWTWIVNAATPAERGMINETTNEPTPREQQMRALVACALAYAEKNPTLDDGCFKQADLAEAVKNASYLVESGGVKKRVHVIRESLAGALFALLADDAERGTWLTVDMGALTTDTTLFFFEPREEFRVAAYYAMNSKIGGVQIIAEWISATHELNLHEAHASMREMSAEEMREVEAFAEACAIVKDAINATMRDAWKTKDAGKHLFMDAGGSRRCLFQFLLIGGGSSAPAIKAFIAKWIWHAFQHLPAKAKVAEIPRETALLSSDGVPDYEFTLDERDQPILAIACGLAQQPWEMPPFANIPEDGGRTPPRNRLDQDWWGGN